MSTILSIEKVQKALTQARAAGMTIPGPGAIDGDWSNELEASLDAYLSSLTPAYHGEVSVLIDQGQIDLVDEMVASGLEQLAQQYEAASGMVSASASSGAIQINANRPRWGLWFGVLLGGVVLGGATWWWMGRKRGQF